MPLGNGYLFVKILVDRSIASLILLFTLPIIGVLAVLIKITSKGPVFFRQERIGKNLKPFKLYKFRTMFYDAQVKFPELYDYKFTRKQILTKGVKPIIIDPLGDPRLTPLGKFMRKNSLDELPNLFNVLKGEMSIIGPRPEPVPMLKYYTKRQKQAFSVRPGITGLAQIKGRGLLSLQETIERDLEYAEKASLLLDIYILFKTIPLLIKQTGAF